MLTTETSSPKQRRKPHPERPRQPMPERPAAERVKDFHEVATGFTAELAIAEAERCLQCKKPLCVQGCPVGINIPAFIDHVANGDFLEGARRIKEDTNLPAICGRVCPQETQCEQTCIVGRKHRPVNIGGLERFVADWERDRGEIAIPEVAPATGKRVAVIGSGPAGLTAAGELARRGHEVTVYESLHEPGGVLVYGIPEFRLPKEIVKREVDTLRRMGVEIRCNVVVGRSLTVDDLFNVGADAVFIGTGAGLPYFLHIPGENLNGVYSANEFLTRVNLMKAYRFPEYHTPVHVGKRVAVFGGGNTAMDAARTALRMGPESVKLIYRRSEAEMPARLEEIHHGKDEGVEFVMLAAPVEFLDGGKGWVSGVKVIHMQLGEPDASGRRRPVPIPASEEVFDIDTAIIAIGNGPHQLVPRTTPGLETSTHGTIVADERSGRTSRPGIFAGGDIVTGAATVIQAMGAGKAAAVALDDYLMSRADAEAQKRHEERLRGYFRAPAAARTEEERIALLCSLGVPDPEEVLNKHLPHWRARLDELLDPESVDMMPIHVSHAHVRYVRGAIQRLPEPAKARLFRTKLGPTGLIDALRKLYREVHGQELGESFTIASVDLLDDVRQSVRVSLYDGGRRFAFDMLRLNPEAEVIFSGLAGVVDVPHCPTVAHTTPRGDLVALSAVPEGENLVHSDALSDEFFRGQWPWIADEIAAQEALADFLGVMMRFGFHILDRRNQRVVTTNHLELFHYVPECDRCDEPVIRYLLQRALPDEPAGRETVLLDVLRRYETAYVRQWKRIVGIWPRIERYLRESGQIVESYTGDRLATTLQALDEATRWNPRTHLTRLYEAHLGELWTAVKSAMWS